MFRGGDKNRLIKQLRDKDPAKAAQAVADLRASGWLSDGSLKGANLVKANLPGADLSGGNLQNADLTEANLAGAILRDADLLGADMEAANLTGADLTGAVLRNATLSRANLRGATVTDAQLVHAAMLTGATMPDGSRYDGRFNLSMDMGSARLNRVHIERPAEMAKWYDVPLEVYEQGQAWAKDHLEALKAEGN
jgi:uncharacterized protein YjbI with pentapeptide repeats